MTRREALLFSGGVNAKYNAPRYWKDLMLWKRALVDRQFFCSIGYADGYIDENQSSGIRTFAAIRNSFQEAMSHYYDMSPEDLLLFVASNHGDPEGMNLWGSGNLISPEDIKIFFEPCKAQKILIFGQCHSGIFSNIHMNNTVIVTACQAHESSYPCYDQASGDYDEFLYRLAKAWFAPHPYHPGLDVHLRQAFEWAREHNRRKVGHDPLAPERGETPTYTDPQNLGERLCLPGPPLLA